MKKKKNLSLSRLLFEQEENQTIPTNVTPGAALQPRNYSLDQKVDHFLIQYERESNPSATMFPDDAGMNAAMFSKGGTQGAGAGFSGGQSAVATPVAMEKGLAESRRFGYSLKSFLWEQEDPAADLTAGAADPAGGADLGAAGDLGGDAGGGGETPEMSVPKPQINLSIFANKVSRLINNFDSLVNPKIVVLNRVYAYIRQNYDENTAKELLIILESTYNLSNVTLGDKEKLLVGQVPFAVGAGESSGGGGA